MQGGLHFGDHGISAYYRRDKHHQNYDDSHHGFGHHATLHGTYHGGHYYPYGYLSTFDSYYYRYPYQYVQTDYDPTWIVYAGAPTTTVFVDQPDQSIYSNPPVSTSPQAGNPIQVTPQNRIPVNNTYLYEGQRAFSEGRYQDARSYFVKASLNEPGNGFVHLAYALSHFAVGDYHAAADAVRRGLSLLPDVVDRPIDVVRQYHDPADFARQLDSLRAYAAATPDAADVWFLLGYLLYSNGNPQEAAQAFEAAATLDPQDTFAAVMRDAAARVTVAPAP